MENTIEGIARAFFVTAWADWTDEYGEGTPAGCDIMEVAPETPFYVVHQAYRFIGMLENQNRMNIYSIMRTAALCDGIPRDSDLPEGFESEFGHCLAMQAMRTGVRWEDHHKPVLIRQISGEDKPLEVPEFEFGVLDLDINNFPMGE